MLAGCTVLRLGPGGFGYAGPESAAGPEPGHCQELVGVGRECEGQRAECLGQCQAMVGEGPQVRDAGSQAGSQLPGVAGSGVRIGGRVDGYRPDTH